MPTYQYTCTECGEQLEAFQSFSDPALTECPNCQGRLRKVFNSVGIVFKGSGFYRTDSRKGAEAGASDVKPAASSGSSDASGSGSGSGSGSSDSGSSGSGSSGSGSSSSSSSSGSGSGSGSSGSGSSSPAKAGTSSS